jgi:hypothetical protein
MLKWLPVTLLALCACTSSEALQLKAANSQAEQRELADAGALILSMPDAARERSECADEMLETSGRCEIALPDAEWVERLDCRAIVRFGQNAFACGGPPDGWSTAEDQLTLHGKSCRAVRAEPNRLLEVFIPCPLF